MLPVYEIRKSDLTVFCNDYELRRNEHMHKYIEIAYVRKGCQHMRIERNEYCLCEGAAAIVFPDTLHAYFSLSETETHDSDILILMASPKIFGKLFPDLGGFRTETPFIAADRINGELRFALDTIRPSLAESIRFSWTCVIMSYLLDIISLKSRGADPVADLAYKLTKYIENNFIYDISRGSLAAEFNVSECYISKIFTDKFKMNLRSYLGTLRSQYAANLIRTTDLTFTAISQYAGFGSLRTFNRMFRQCYGMTPQEYKKHLIK